MEPRLPPAPAPDSEALARAEARLLAALSRMHASAEVTASGSADSPTHVRWREPQAAWEAAHPEEPGAAGRYRFGEVFARGGLGAIRRAEDRKLGRTVAVKELLRFDDQAVQRFVREAEITARLQHPGIVPLYDLGRDPQGRPFLCMKLIEGDSLEAAIAARADLPARLELLPHLLAAADAIAYAHRRGVVHRDLKPANILVGEHGETVVIDWGLAKDLSARTDDDAGPAAPPDTISDLTAAGSLLGTVRYMPPEQARGETIDPRSDVYALGATLYHLLSGAPPFHDRKSAQLLHDVLERGPAPLPSRAPEVPRALVAIVEKAMSREPGARYPDAGALAEDLRKYAAGRLVGAHDYSLAEIGGLWLRRHRTAAIVGAGALSLLTALGGAAVARISAARAEAEAGRGEAREAQALAEQRADAADAARSLADRRADALVLAQARGALDDDAGAALGWLAQLGGDPSLDAEARLLALAARARGVPVRALQGPEVGRQVVTLADGTIVAEGRDGQLWRWRPGEDIGEAIGPVGDVVTSPDGNHWVVVRPGEIEVHRAGRPVTRFPVTVERDGAQYGWFLRADGSTLFGVSRSAESVEVALDDGSRRPLVGPDAPAAVAGVTLVPSPDGSLLAGVREGRTLVVWERATGRVRTQSLPAPAALRPSFSASGHVLEVRMHARPGTPVDGGVVNFPDRVLVWPLAGAPRVVDADDVSFAGGVAVFGRERPEGVRIWAEEAATGQELWARSMPPASSIMTAGFGPWASHDGRLVWWSTGDRVEVVDARSGASLFEGPAHGHRPERLGRAGMLLVGDDGLRVFDVLGAPWQPRGPAAPAEGAWTTALSPGGGFVVRQRAQDGVFERVEVARGVTEALPEGCGAWTRGRWNGATVADDGRVLLAGMNAMCLWDARGVRSQPTPSHLREVVFAPESEQVWLYFLDGGVRRWDGSDDSLEMVGKTGPTRLNAAVEGGRGVAFAGLDGGLQLFDAEGTRSLLPPALPPTARPMWPDAALTTAPDGRTLALYLRETGTARIVDVTGAAQEELSAGTPGVSQERRPRLRFDASGTNLALLDGERVLRWSRAAPESPVETRVADAVDVAFAPDARSLVVLRVDGGLQLVDPEAGVQAPLRPAMPQGYSAHLQPDAQGGVLLLTSTGALHRWRDELPPDDARAWIREAAQRAAPR